MSRGGSGKARALALQVPWLGGSDAPAAWLPGVDALVLAVRDRDLPAIARALAAEPGWPGRVVVHLSGSLPASLLEPLRQVGASVGSFHPLISLAAEPDGRPAAIPIGTPFFAEGDAHALGFGRALALAVGGRFVELRSDDKALYHAGATIAGNLTAVLHAAGAEMLRMAGVEDSGGESVERALLPLARASVDAVAAHRGIAGLTGPLSRGDLDTLVANIAALRHAGSSLRRAHAAVSLLGLDLLEDLDALPEHQAEMRAVLRAVLAEIPHEA